MDKETKEVMDNMSQRLESMDGLFTEFHSLLNNHMTDFSAKFGRLKKSVEDAIEAIKEVNAARDQALNTKIDSYKWTLKLIVTFTGVAIGGLVAIAIWALTVAF